MPGLQLELTRQVFWIWKLVYIYIYLCVCVCQRGRLSPPSDPLPRWPPPLFWGGALKNNSRPHQSSTISETSSQSWGSNPEVDISSSLILENGFRMVEISHPWTWAAAIAKDNREQITRFTNHSGIEIQACAKTAILAANVYPHVSCKCKHSEFWILCVYAVSHIICILYICLLVSTCTVIFGVLTIFMGSMCKKRVRNAVCTLMYVNMSIYGYLDTYIYIYIIFFGAQMTCCEGFVNLG